jgi:hypothetical protein
MKAIIIEEERFREIRELINCKSNELINAGPQDGMDRIAWNAAIEQAHRTFNYYFVKWAQSHGASCT